MDNIKVRKFGYQMSERCNHTLGYRKNNDQQTTAVSMLFLAKNPKIRAEVEHWCKFCPECGKKLYEPCVYKIGDQLEIVEGCNVVALLPIDLHAGLKTTGQWGLDWRDVAVRGSKLFLCGVYEVQKITGPGPNRPTGEPYELEMRLVERSIRASRSDNGVIRVVLDTYNLELIKSCDTSANPLDGALYCFDGIHRETYQTSSGDELTLK